MGLLGSGAGVGALGLGFGAADLTGGVILRLMGAVLLAGADPVQDSRGWV